MTVMQNVSELCELSCNSKKRFCLFSWSHEAMTIHWWVLRTKTQLYNYSDDAVSIVRQLSGVVTWIGESIWLHSTKANPSHSKWQDLIADHYITFRLRLIAGAPTSGWIRTTSQVFPNSVDTTVAWLDHVHLPSAGTTHLSMDGWSHNHNQIHPWLDSEDTELEVGGGVGPDLFQTCRSQDPQRRRWKTIKDKLILLLHSWAIPIIAEKLFKSLAKCSSLHPSSPAAATG